MDTQLELLISHLQILASEKKNHVIFVQRPGTIAPCSFSLSKQGLAVKVEQAL